jgi:hypothetical protein
VNLLVAFLIRILEFMFVTGMLGTVYVIIESLRENIVAIMVDDDMSSYGDAGQ